MSDCVRLAVGQFDSAPGDVAANLARCEELAAEAARLGAQMLCLPELCTTGYRLPRQRFLEIAEPVSGPTVERLAGIASRSKLYLIAGVAERDDERLHDSLVAISPEGKLLGCYRKVNVTPGEREIFEPGDSLCIIGTEFGPIGLMICYDHIFPEFVRALALRGPRVIFHSAAWFSNDACDAFGWDGPTYQAIVRIRALENRLFIASANRVGVEPPVRHLGYSCIAAPWGKILASLEGADEGVAVAEADFGRLAEWATIARYPEDRKVDFFRRNLDW